MKRILIVGGAGYIGGYMTDTFMKNPHYHITVYDNLLYEPYYMKNVEFIYGDVTDNEKLEAIINNFDVVIWLAAIVGDGACAVNPALTTKVNVDSVKWLVDNYGGKIVFMSTCSVYGINHELLDEDAIPNPISHYAVTKLAAERYIVENSKDYIIFRLGTLYGIGDRNSRIRLDLVVNILALRAVFQEPITVFGGKQWRPILHVKDVTHAVKLCLDRDIKGLYNLSERNIDISELAETIVKRIPGSEILNLEQKFEDLRDYKVNNDRIKAHGWFARFSLIDGIDEMAAVYREHRIKNVNDNIYSNEKWLNQIFVEL